MSTWRSGGRRGSASPEEFGPNDWLVDEMYRQYAEDPSSVSESWQDFFSDYRPQGDGRAATSPPAPRDQQRRPGGVVPVRESPDDADEPARNGETQARPAARRATRSAKAQPAEAPRKPVPVSPPSEVPAGAVQLKGAASRIASNMRASLEVPAATSARVVPAKLLEENRRIVNDHLAATRGGKVSFTHLVGWAILRALRTVPVMNSSYVDHDGKAYVVHHEHVNLGLAVDVQRPDGSRTLLVPNVKFADQLDFGGFWSAYEDVIRRVRANQVRPDDVAGTTVTLTNPGTIGTVLSVPRLMPGQGVIVGTGAIDYPAEFRGADPGTVAALGVGKVMTVTSTYDHRIIQGAESGEFLDAISDLLMGEGGFYEDVFASLGVPYEPVQWTRDRGWELGERASDPMVEKNARVLQLINMYRVRGHLVADLNPLVSEMRHHYELDPSVYGLGVWDFDREFITGGLAGRDRATLREILDILRNAYCRTVGVEYMHIQEADQKQWIQQRIEGRRPELSAQEKARLLDRLNAAEAFERFLHTKYVGHKRFGLEGGESLIPMLSWVLDDAADAGMQEAVIAMAHRGRLNALANIVGKSYAKIFREFEGDIDPDSSWGSGDVKYHLGARGTWTAPSGREIAVSLPSNPSHLEAVDPVAEGIVRAKQDLAGEGGADAVLPVLVHGDGAFAGQGVVAETLNLSQLPGYRTGGTVHVVVNNQIGFTTPPEAARSSVYATDVAKMVQAPILHVNGDDAEACVWVVDLAFAFRQAFHKDVVVDLFCYRRYGHNETDEPAYTQPVLYAQIEGHRSVRKLYTEKLVNRGDLSLEEAEQALDDFRRRLDDAFVQTRTSTRPTEEPPTRVGRPPDHLDVDTRVDRECLERISTALSTFPDGFEPHPKLGRQLVRRGEALARDDVDWALAEAFAFGSLLVDGRVVRLAGQDTRRGTFSHRHSVVVDHRSGVELVPLNAIEGATGRLLAYDSLLSEYAALGFEYGYAVGNRDALVLWEAQFGDFVNGAQVVVDQYVVASEDKWAQTCGLTMLLPHGYEGQGPEHSSARLERFLTLCAEDNLRVAQPTTPAQYFHLLRRQAIAEPKRPLVVLTPKWLLRHPAARSAAAELTEGRFREVLADAPGDASRVRRVLLCTGKIAFVLRERRDKLGRDDVAIVRLEQMYPFPYVALDEVMSSYANRRDVFWLQDEPENMGAWTFVFSKTHRLLPGLQPVARAESASPAAGSGAVHQMEEEELLEAAFDGL